jgi:hypothetical protein
MYNRGMKKERYRSLLVLGLISLIIFIAGGVFYFEQLFSASANTDTIKSEEISVNSFDTSNASIRDNIQVNSSGADSGSVALKKNSEGIPLGGTYTSDIIRTNFEFNAIAPLWTEERPAPTDIQIAIMVYSNGKPTEWVTVDKGAGKDVQGSSLAKSFAEVPVFAIGDSFRYRITLDTTDGQITPIVKNIRFTYIDSRQKQNIISIAKALFTPSRAAAATTIPGVVSRNDWGCPDPSGELLVNDTTRYWPADYSPVKKIILHHTAGAATNDSAADVRAIWQWHTYSVEGTGWGDIGYNYLVDKNGKVYEGRYGGDNVIAGHTKYYNTGSMGVAMLGDFSSVLPSSTSLLSLNAFLGKKASDFGIEPVGTDNIVKKDTNGNVIGTATVGNIDGHKVYNPTACPGLLFNTLADIRYQTNVVFREQQLASLVNSYPISTSLSLPDSPAIGEKLTATFRIENKTANSVTFQYLGVANRLGGTANRDFPWQEGITVSANGYKDITVERINTELGNYSSWISYCIDGVWYNASPQTTQTVSKTYNTRIPRLQAMTTITINPNNPIAWQAATFSTTVYNKEENTIYYSHLGLAARDTANNANSDIGWISNSYIGGKSSQTITRQRRLPAGNYMTWTSIHIGSSFIDIWDGLNLNHAYFTVNPINQYLLVSSPLSLPDNPAIGEKLTATFRIENKTANSVTFQYLGVANRLNGAANRDFPWQTSVTVSENGYKDVSVERINTELGNYTSWISYSLDGLWYNASPQTTQTVSKTYATRIPRLQAMTTITISPNYPIAEQSATYSTTVYNKEENMIYYSNLGLAARNTANNANSDIGWISNSNIGGKSSQTITKQRSLPAGNYLTWTSLNIGSSFIDIWDGLNLNHAYFTVVDQIDTLDGVQIPATSGLVAREQHLYLNSGEADLGRTLAAALHYTTSGTPTGAQNGMAGGYGAFGSNAGYNLPIEDERYYINMRWSYVNWFESPDGSCSSAPDGHPDTCTSNYNSSSKNWHYRKKVIVTNPANGKRVVASVLEAGPAIWTGRVSGLSPEAMLAISASTNNNLNYYWAADQSIPLGPLN